MKKNIKYIIIVGIVAIIIITLVVLFYGIRVGNININPIFKLTLTNSISEETVEQQEEKYLSDNEIKKIAKEYARNCVSKESWKLTSTQVLTLSDGVVGKSTEGEDYASVAFSVNSISKYDYEELTKRTIGSVRIIINKKTGAIIKSTVNKSRY